MFGFTLSSFTTTEPFPTLPSLSVAVEANVFASVFPDCESVAGVGPLATPEPDPSFADQVILTWLLLFHPAAFAAGESDAVTVGPVLSRMYEADFGLCDCPVQAPALKFGDAAALTVWTPSPEPAVNENDHDDFAVSEVCRALWAPVIWTHFVSLDVNTLSVSAPPFFA
jgi:hypothetical protein